MNMDYKCKIHKDFKELKKDDPELAEKLLDEVNKGEWMEGELYVYPDDHEFAKYELSEGWYCDCDFDRNFNGAPNPFNYIDMDSFARALVNSWDDSCNREIGEKIITTNYGW